MARTGGQGFWLGGRRVIVRTGTKSQTVNVCTRRNAPGEYEAVYRLPVLSAIAASDVPEMADLHAFGIWLVETRNALLEGPSGRPAVPGAAVSVSAADEAWLRVAAGLIHKEWPETVPGREVDRRGLFDLAVLAPSQPAQASIEQFRQGRIHAPIVVEVGLDYGRAHLEQDLEKLRNSEVPYAHVPPAGGRAVKHLADTGIIWSEQALLRPEIDW